MTHESSIDIEEANELAFNNNDDVFQVAECDTVSSATSLITRSLNNSNVIGFRIKLKEKLEFCADENVKRLMWKIDHNHSILMAFELPNGDGHFISWKLTESESFFHLKIDVTHAEVADFMRKFIVESLRINHNGESRGISEIYLIRHLNSSL